MEDCMINEPEPYVDEREDPYAEDPWDHLTLDDWSLWYALAEGESDQQPIAWFAGESLGEFVAQRRAS